MWIIYGGLGLLGNLMSLGVGVGVQTFVGFAMSLGFLITGIQALSGRAKSLLGSGIASIILGVIVLLALFVLGSMVNDKAPMAVIAAIGLAFGGMLITAGILACLGNTKFKLWRAYRGL
ncbi:MAG TPA: hypothetical protein VMJ10_00350 [Kofleriaceae bacterium]|nr:hypothetical protein [Kofleriaceae bacterium]